MTSSLIHSSGLFEDLEKIGEGTYSNVYKAKCRLTKRIVAVKEIRTQETDGAPSTALREIAFLREINHPNIVRLYQVIHNESQLLLVFECLNRDLKQLIDSNISEGKISTLMYNNGNSSTLNHPPWYDVKLNSFNNTGGSNSIILNNNATAVSPNPVLSVETIRSYMFQLLSGVAWCHEHQIMHRDLKPQNLLIDDNTGYLKIADFGLARGYGVPVSGYSSEVVTLWYRAPEILMGSNSYGTHIDIWSVGCIMAEMYTGRALFPGANPDDQLQKIFQILGAPSNEQWSDLVFIASNIKGNEQKSANICKNQRLDFIKDAISRFRPAYLDKLIPSLDPLALDLLKNLLELSPRKRVNAASALLHPYFQYLK